MKKVISMCLLCILLLTACAPPTPPIEETTTDTPSGNETTLAPPDDDTTTTEDTETTTPEETTDVTDIWGPPMSSYCYDLKDFYIYATTGSRDPDLYTHKATQSEVEYYWDIEPNARLLLDDIIPTDEFSDLIEFVSFTSDFFIYTFENITLGYFDIIIFYSDELKIEETFEKDGCTIQETPLVEGYRFDLNNSENKIYLSEVDGIQFYRKICVDGSKRYPVFVAWLDGFYFQIIIHSEYSYSRIFDNPKGHGIAAFFDDSQVAEALQKFKTAIENVPSSEPN